MWFKSRFTVPAVVAISFCLIGGTSPAAADILHVPGDFPTIQAGIDAAVDGDEVLVADGVYTGEGNRDLDFDGKLITVRSENGPDNCIIDCQANPDDLHRGFYLHSGETNDAVIDGFTVTNGYAPGFFDDKRGGGILCEGSSPTITNCTLVNNTASRGGGIMLVSITNPVIDGCTIIANEGLFGTGGIMVWGGGGNLTITNTTVSGNSGMQIAGGISCQDVVLTITNCIISANMELPGIGSGAGGIVVIGNGSATITDCTITENRAADGGAGGVDYLASGPLIMDNCTISGNSTTFKGGGVRWSSHHEPGSITNCVISDNMAGDSGGGIVLSDSSPIWISPILANCTITGNSAGQDGGGLLCVTGTPAVVNCSITGNSAGQDGGGLLFVTGTPAVVNCSISGNTAASRGGGIACLGSAATLIAMSNTILWNNDALNGAEIALTQEGGHPAGLIVDYCDVQGGQEVAHVEGDSVLFWGEGNIDADPLFVAPGIGDYGLSSGSPCIDAGDNDAVPADESDLDNDGDTDEPIPFDLDGNPRFIDDPLAPDTGAGDCPIVDMGAYEFQKGTTCCPADLDGDGAVGAADLAMLLGSWGPCEGCPADLDGNGQVGPFDLALLLGAWGECE